MGFAAAEPSQDAPGAKLNDGLGGCLDSFKMGRSKALSAVHPMHMTTRVLR